MFIEMHDLVTTSAKSEISISLFAETSRSNRVAINMSPLCGDDSFPILRGIIEDF
jgi:hypothetical protein